MVVGLLVLFTIAIVLTDLLVYVPLWVLDGIHLPLSLGAILALALLTWLMGDR
jgi:hypothetical protein